MTTYLLTKDTKDIVAKFICEQRSSEYQIEECTSHILNSIIESTDSYACVAETDRIQGVIYVFFYQGKQMWSRGSILGSIEQITIASGEAYEEAARSLYAMAQNLLKSRNGLKLTVNDFSDTRFFSSNGLDYERCKIESFL